MTMTVQHGDPGFAERYRAIDGRDARFDGQFFTAVLSTGIYCRPSCPARTPKPANVRFYATSAAAHEAGFRACKRCLPEAAPGTPEWNLRQSVASRAMRLIADGVVDREGVQGLADRLGFTTRHVQRMLVAELGAGPVALARARRAQSARALLVGSDLPIAQVAFAAGFGSVRQCNDTVRAIFGVTPGELRTRARRASRPATAALTVDLPVRHPYDAPGVFGFLAARVVAGVERAELADDRLVYARTLSLPQGAGAAEVTAVPGAAGWRLTAQLELASPADAAPAVTRIRRLFDLDADPVAVDAALSEDAALAASVAAVPGIRLPGAVDAHEMIVRAMVGQQISVVAAHGHLSRLAAEIGEPYEGRFEGLTRLFPSAQRIARLDADTLDADRPLRLPRAQTAAIVAVCAALAEGDLDVHVGLSAAELRSRLTQQPRIGEWTAQYVAMRVLGDPDAWLLGDVALLAGARSLGLLDAGLSKAAQHAQLAARAERWAPWRAYAAMHVWQAA